MKSSENRAPRTRTIAVIGLGNIGSQVIPLLAHLPGLGRVILLDRDVYEPGNLATQAITPGDIGKPKAAAQARRLRRLNPLLAVEAIVASVETVPIGRLQADVVLCGLDSLAARLAVGEGLWRLGAPWFDAGVDPARQLVRITGYRPGTALACPWCGLDEGDFRALGARHPCQGAAIAAPATNGPASLGAVAAALLVTEAQRVFGGNTAEDGLGGRQLIADLAHHRMVVSALRRDPACRFDHTVWRPRSCCIDTSMTLDAFRAAAGRRCARGAGPCTVSFGRPLALTLHCPRCGHAVRQPRLVGREGRRCPACDQGRLRGSGFSVLLEIAATAPPAVRRASLRSLGVQPGDLVSVTDARRQVTHLVIGDANICERRKSRAGREAQAQALADETGCEAAPIRAAPAIR